MALRALIFAGLLLATPAVAQDSSSSSTESSFLSLDQASSSLEPLQPAGTSDAELELIVRAAYTGAAAFADAHARYFARDGVLPPLHDAVAAELAKDGHGTVAVPVVGSGPLGSGGIDACLAVPGTELRMFVNTYGDGLMIVAVTDTRTFGYAYDPHKAADIVVTKATDCAKPK